MVVDSMCLEGEKEVDRDEEEAADERSGGGERDR